MEDRVVAAAETFLNGQRPQHLSLHFDGCMVCGTTGEEGVTAERIASEVAARSYVSAVASLGAGNLRRRSSRRAHGQHLRVSEVTFRRTRPAATRRTGTHAEHVPSMARHIQQKVPNRRFLLNSLVGLVPPAGRAKFLVHVQDQDGPRCVCMQSDGAGKYNGSELTTLPALSLFTTYDKAIDASDVVTFHVTDTDVHDATKSLLDLLV